MNTIFCKKEAQKGLGLIELIIALLLGSILVGVVMSMWAFAYKNWSLERIRSKMRVELESGMERIKDEVRLSNNNYMSFYPSGATEYTAVSFPLPTRNAQGFLTLDVDGNILWDRSVIYHMYENPSSSGNFELRRTEFTSNNAYLINDTLRDTQLSSVVTIGNGSAALNSGNASVADIVFDNCEEFLVRPKTQLFDGYNTTTTRSGNILFGSVRLDPAYAGGYHDLKFEVVGTSAAGYGMGIDTISITPSGCAREVEFYDPLSSPHSHSGGTSSKEYQSGWSGNNYLEYSSGAVGDYVNLRLYYDVWLESNFHNSVRTNTLLTGDDLEVKLQTPKQGGGVCWQAVTEAGVSRANVTIPAPSGNGVSIRNILSSANLEKAGNMTRIRFSDFYHNLSVKEAYITERLSDDDGTGAAVQLYFSDGELSLGSTEPDTYGLQIGNDSGLANASCNITAGYYSWSNWANFTVDTTKDYLLTAYVDNGIACATSVNFTVWVGAETNSYYAENNSASTVVWTGSTATNNTSFVELADSWQSYGTVTGATYDTGLSDPAYSNISWTETLPAGTDIILKTRSSDDANMSGASAWSSISGSGTNPHSISSIGTGRYVEFQANLSVSPPYTCVESDYPSIDNVAIDWPGPETSCEISGYFTQKSSYGIIKLTVDGDELTKGFEFDATTYENMQGVKYSTSLVTEIEPRNTGN
ncbi:MAG: hypothetical protein ABID09_05570 [Candidatus Omnitrophota bacterium]